MLVIVDCLKLSQMKSCRKEPQSSRNHLLQQRNNSFNKILNSLFCKQLLDAFFKVGYLCVAKHQFVVAVDKEECWQFLNSV